VTAPGYNSMAPEPWDGLMSEPPRGSYEDPAEGMLNPPPPDEREPWVEGVHYRWEEPESSGCLVGCLVVLLSTLIVVGAIAGLAWWLL